MLLRPRIIILSLLLIALDAALLHILTTVFSLAPPVARLLSLGGAIAVCAIIQRVTRPSDAPPSPPELRPLVSVSLLLSFSLFALLATRAPQVQPLLHLSLSWVAALLFWLLGYLRLRRRAR
ncbi:hypothetical protein M0654_10465 [Rhizobium sp. NTR19]|uniref:Uncharacterized protein n=1 Tax=Neorhizobium turbinariae TaxID=2937795 RepID=A0ABT0IRA6_9HYPH|nr:hypothetical protein [Neorhizobium turbinariae]MCK8780406.1 hypothetical protein [Neorhizobium turbinariae]